MKSWRFLGPHGSAAAKLVAVFFEAGDIDPEEVKAKAKETIKARGSLSLVFFFAFFKGFYRDSYGYLWVS